MFVNLLTAPRTISNTYAQVARAQLCANHVQHVERLSRAICRDACHVVRRDSSAIKFDRIEISFILAFYFVGWIIIRWKGGGGGGEETGVPGENTWRRPS